MGLRIVKAAMQTTVAATLSLTLLGAQPALSHSQEPSDSTELSKFEVSEYSVGPVFLGSTVGEARANAPDLSFVRGGGPENSIVVDVMQGDTLLMKLFTLEELEYDDAGNAPAIDNGAIITGIEILEPRFKTAGGVHVGMEAAGAERSLGKLTGMINHPHGGETPTFAHQPSYLSLTVTMPEGSESYTAGIYEPIEDCNELYPPSCQVATRFNPGAQIASISVGQGVDSPQRLTEIVGLPAGYRLLHQAPTAESCETGSPIATYIVWPDYPASDFSIRLEVDGAIDCTEEFETLDWVDYEKQRTVILDDLNFDDALDLAIFRGNIGGYGSPAYDIYLFDEPSGSYVKHEQLSELTMSLGMFDVNREDQSYTVYGKSGCCYHVVTDYKFTMEEAESDAMPNLGPLEMVYEKIIESTSETEGSVTERTLVGDKWIETKRPKTLED